MKFYYFIRMYESRIGCNRLYDLATFTSPHEVKHGEGEVQFHKKAA